MIYFHRKIIFFKFGNNFFWGSKETLYKCKFFLLFNSMFQKKQWRTSKAYFAGKLQKLKNYFSSLRMLYNVSNEWCSNLKPKSRRKQGRPWKLSNEELQKALKMRREWKELTSKIGKIGCCNRCNKIRYKQIYDYIEKSAFLIFIYQKFILKQKRTKELMRMWRNMLLIAYIL